MRKPAGLFNKLTGDQKKAALAYEGPVLSGNPSFPRIVAAPATGDAGEIALSGASPTLLTPELVEKVAKVLVDQCVPYEWEILNTAHQEKWKTRSRAALEAALPDIEGFIVEKLTWALLIKQEARIAMRLAGLKEAMEIMLRCPETPEHSEGVAALIAIRARIAELEA